MREIEVNKKYRHFKGDVVEVLLIGKDSEDLTKKVIYKHNGEIWVRDYAIFNSLVDIKKYPNVTQKYRFEELD